MNEVNQRNGLNKVKARLVCAILASCLTGVLVLGANTSWILAELPPSPVPTAVALVLSAAWLIYIVVD